MDIGEILSKINPAPQQRETSQSEYKKLVDTNTKLIDKIKDQEEEIVRLNHEADTYMKIAVARQKRIDKAIEYIEKEKQKFKKNAYVEMHINAYNKKQDELLEILKGENKE